MWSEVHGNSLAIIVKYLDCIIRFECFIQFIIYYVCNVYPYNRFKCIRFPHILYALSLFHYFLTFTRKMQKNHAVSGSGIDNTPWVDSFFFTFLDLTQTQLWKQKCNIRIHTRGESASHADLIQLFPNLFIIFN